jgi:NAD(P)H-dependent FMN reductase
MSKILAINASYRPGGIIDQAVAALALAVQGAGDEVEIILLRDYPLEFCLNCRACTQPSGPMPGACVHQDNMASLIARIEGADGYILAAPTNFGSVTALFQRFLERLAVYAYWPWAMNGPRLRKATAPRKKAILISSCAAPGIIGRWLFGSEKQLKMTAKTIGAKSVGTLFIGMIARDPRPELPERVRAKLKALATRLVSGEEGRNSPPAQ